MEPVKEGHRSGSYDDKKNTLMKAGGLALDPRNQETRIVRNILGVTVIATLLQAVWQPGYPSDFRLDAWNFLTGSPGILSLNWTKSRFAQAMLAQANQLSSADVDLVGRVINYGMALQFLTVQTAVGDLRFSLVLREAAKEALAPFVNLGIDVNQVISQAATQLANFLIDGTYNFTFILFPSPSQPNGAVGTGTAAIDSEYDGYTNGLAQKIINQNITTPFSMNILQTLDISYNSILIDTYGTSNTGKYTIEGNILTIYSYGYSNGTIFFGEFINDIVKIIKTDIGYIVQHNKINPDNSIGPLIDVVYYVRQLTIPDEDEKKFEIAFKALDVDRNGYIDRINAQSLVKIALPTNVSKWENRALGSYVWGFN
jgi:hypothetical protein